MVKFENECCNCAVPGYPCIGDLCKYRNVPHFYCDHCHEEICDEELFDTEEGELCMECAKELITEDDIEDLVRNLYDAIDTEDIDF